MCLVLVRFSRTHSIVHPYGPPSESLTITQDEPLVAELDRVRVLAWCSIVGVSFPTTYGPPTASNLDHARWTKDALLWDVYSIVDLVEANDLLCGGVANKQACERNYSMRN